MLLLALFPWYMINTVQVTRQLIPRTVHVTSLVRAITVLRRSRTNRGLYSSAWQHYIETRDKMQINESVSPRLTPTESPKHVLPHGKEE